MEPSLACALAQKILKISFRAIQQFRAKFACSSKRYSQGFFFNKTYLPLSKISLLGLTMSDKNTLSVP